MTTVTLEESINTRALNAIALHPSGEKVALITAYHRVQLQHITETPAGTLSAEVIASDTPVTGRIRSLLTDDDNLAVATTSDNSVLFFDALTGHLLRRISLNAEGTRNHEMLFSPDRSLLIVTGQSEYERDTHLHVIDVQAAITGADNPFYRESVTVEDEYLSGIAFLEDGRFLTGGGVGRLWRFGRTTMFVDEDLAHLRGLTVFSASPEGDLLATVRPGSYLSILRTTPLNVVYENRLTGRMIQEDIFVDFLPNGEHVVLALNGQEVRLYDVASGLEIATLTRSRDTIQDFQDVTILDDLLLLSHNDGLYLWNTETLPQTTDARHIKLQHTAQEIALSRGGSRLLAVGNDGRIYVYNAD
jgi:WD40 repeat protein